jgi:hypothetical protein
MHLDRSTIVRWEPAGSQPRPYLWPKLAKLLGVTHQELAKLFVDDEELGRSRSAADQLPGQAVPWDDMKRRTLVKWGVVTTAAAGLGVGASTAVGLADVQRLQRAAARLHSLDQQHGGASLWQAALTQAHDGVQLLEYGSYTDSVGLRLVSATGRLQYCAGWLALDAGQHEIARTCFTDALTMSRHAEDAQTEMLALANLAMQSNDLARPREALRYAAGAEQAASGAAAAPWLAVIPQGRLAIASSLMGDACGADRAISQARRVLEHEDDTEPEEWSSFLSPSYVDGVEAACAMELQRAARAERLLEQAIAGYPQQCARNLALIRVRLARARLDQNAVDGAAEASHAALDDLSGEVASWRVGSELAAVAQRLAAYPEVEGVEGFLTRYQTAN